MEEGTKTNFENKVANNFYKFISREVYSCGIDEFESLTFIIKVIMSNKSRNVLHKYFGLFFHVLGKVISGGNGLTVYQFRPIINEALSSALKAKQDYVIILRYLAFLIEHEEIDEGIRFAQDMAMNPNYMNNGEIYFYRGLLEFFKNKQNSTQIGQNFEKAVNFIASDEEKYIAWIARFYVRNNMMKELRDFLRLEKVKKCFGTNRLSLYNALSDPDSNELMVKLDLLSKEIVTSFWDLEAFAKFDSLLDKVQAQKKKKKFEKLLNLGRHHIVAYLNFLMTYINYDPFNTFVLNKLVVVFQEELTCLKLGSLSETHLISFKDSIYHTIDQNFDVLLKNVVVRLFLKRLLKLGREYTQYNSVSEEILMLTSFMQVVNLVANFHLKKGVFPENLMLSKNFSLQSVKALISFVKSMKLY